MSTLGYPGGKAAEGTWQWINSLMPLHTAYIEPFAGHAATYRLKTPAMNSILMDADAATVAWLRRQFQRHSSTEIFHQCGIAFLERLTQFQKLNSSTTLVYCDPPYHPLTRVRLKQYDHELSDADRRRFLKAAKRLECGVMISGYFCSLYQQELRDWELHSREVMTRGGTKRTECLWRNRVCQESPLELTTEYSALGGDRRARERVARLVRRWETDFRGRSPIERVALLQALINAQHELQCELSKGTAAVAVSGGGRPRGGARISNSERRRNA